MITVDVRTVKAGRAYRAKVSGGPSAGSYQLMLDSNAMVHIHTPTNALGLWRLERFGGKLTPVAIRKFFGYGNEEEK